MSDSEEGQDPFCPDCGRSDCESGESCLRAQIHLLRARVMTLEQAGIANQRFGPSPGAQRVPVSVWEMPNRLR